MKWKTRDTQLEERLTALVETRLRQHFPGVALDGPAPRQVVEYLTDLQARISVDRASGRIIERDANDPTRVHIHWPPERGENG